MKTEHDQDDQGNRVPKDKQKNNNYLKTVKYMYVLY